jgi:hypothetical protein
LPFVVLVVFVVLVLAGEAPDRSKRFAAVDSPVRRDQYSRTMS